MNFKGLAVEQDPPDSCTAPELIILDHLYETCVWSDAILVDGVVGALDVGEET